MKIISDFSDYYDGCNYSTSSETGIYERKTSTVPVDWVKRYWSHYSPVETVSFETKVLGFCGELYPIIEYKYLRHSHDGENTRKLIYSFEELDEIRNSFKIKQMYNRPLIDTWGKVDYAKLWFDKNFEACVNGEVWRRYKHNGSQALFLKNPSDVFLKYRVPCFLIEYSDDRKVRVKESVYHIVLNPCLKDLEFFKVMDNYTCFQKIEMFMNNQIVRPDDPYIAPIDDKIKAHSKGFDRFSFRRDKSKK